MFFARLAPALPPRDFPLLLRREWRIDNTPQAGRLRALTFVAIIRDVTAMAHWTGWLHPAR